MKNYIVQIKEKFRNKDDGWSYRLLTVVPFLVSAISLFRYGGHYECTVWFGCVCVYHTLLWLIWAIWTLFDCDWGGGQKGIISLLILFFVHSARLELNLIKRLGLLPLVNFSIFDPNSDKRSGLNPCRFFQLWPKFDKTAGLIGLPLFFRCFIFFLPIW